MAGRIALIAGQGRLPELLAAAAPDALVFEMEGFPTGLGGERFRLERLVPFLDRLHDLGVGRVVFAGAIRRPRLDPALFDPRTAALVPRVAAAMGRGDDGLLREVLAIFEAEGLAVLGAEALAPDLLPGAGVLGAFAPQPGDLRDLGRAAAIAAALGAVDVGQGAVVAQGLCLAVEALPGTDAMLDFVARNRRGAAGRGVLYKAPKPGQEVRLDRPAIGPATVAGAAAAGLAGIAYEAGGVLLLDRAAAVAAADAAGLFLWGRDPGAE